MDGDRVLSSYWRVILKSPAEQEPLTETLRFGDLVDLKRVEPEIKKRCTKVNESIEEKARLRSTPEAKNRVLLGRYSVVDVLGWVDQLDGLVYVSRITGDWMKKRPVVDVKPPVDRGTQPSLGLPED